MIVITGFAPFGDLPDNPSRTCARMAVSYLNAEGIDAAFVEVPVEFDSAFPTVQNVVLDHRLRAGDGLVCVGVAANRRVISLETTAKNIIDARIPDNAGKQPRDSKIDPEGPDTLATRLPVEAALKAMQGAGIKADFSSDAGEYVCNCLFYESVNDREMKAHGVQVGFVHVPLEEAVSLADQTKALVILAREIGKEARRKQRLQPELPPRPASGLATKHAA